MPVITILNRKGGVGKTSVCWHLGGMLASMGKSVLAIDLDPQSSLTAAAWGDEAVGALDPDDTIAAAWGDEPKYVFDVKLASGTPLLEIVPGSEALAARNLADPEAAPHRDQLAIASFLDGAADDWDVVLIDTPPQLQLLTWSALLASTHALVPLQPEDFGAKGLAPVAEMAARARAGLNPGLAPEILLLSMVNRRTSIHQMYEKRLRDRFGAAILDAVVPSLTGFKEAITNRLPIHRHQPGGAAAEAMRSVAEEFLGRLAGSSPVPTEVANG